MFIHVTIIFMELSCTINIIFTNIIFIVENLKKVLGMDLEFFLIRIHSTQGWRATTSHGYKGKKRLKELKGCLIFQPKMANLLKGRNFCRKIINITLTYLFAPYYANLKTKWLEWIQSYDNASFLGPKWYICPKIYIFRKRH